MKDGKFKVYIRPKRETKKNSEIKFWRQTCFLDQVFLAYF